jgi:hypothetical protein
MEKQKDRETMRQKDRETMRQKDGKTERQRDNETERQRDNETERQEMQICYQLKIFRNYLAYSSVNLTYINIIGLGFKRKRGAEGGRRGPNFLFRSYKIFIRIFIGTKSVKTQKDRRTERDLKRNFCVFH